MQERFNFVDEFFGIRRFFLAYVELFHRINGRRKFHI